MAELSYYCVELWIDELDRWWWSGTRFDSKAEAVIRHGITVDRSADYCRLAAWRTSDRGELARALQVDKPQPVPDEQEALFAMPP